MGELMTLIMIVAVFLTIVGLIVGLTKFILNPAAVGHTVGPSIPQDFKVSYDYGDLKIDAPSKRIFDAKSGKVFGVDDVRASTEHWTDVPYGYTAKLKPRKCYLELKTNNLDDPILRFNFGNDKANMSQCHSQISILFNLR